MTNGDCIIRAKAYEDRRLWQTHQIAVGAGAKGGLRIYIPE